MEKTLNLIKNDPWLEPFAGAITGRHQHVLDKEAWPPVLLIFIWWVHLIIGRKKQPIS